MKHKFAIIFVLCTLPCAAQQTWWVQSADYGAGNQRQDVTNTLRQRVNGPNFQINSGTMGANPAPGMNKTLRIVARDSAGKVRDFHYKDGAILNTAMFSGAPAPSWGGRPPSWWNGNQPGWGGGGNPPPPGWGGNQPGNNYGLNIVSATWGAGRQTQDVTNRLQGYVRNNRISVRANPQNFGDPAYGVSKTLNVTYIYQGRRNTATIPEGAVFSVP
jgi:hypothetical protein